MRNDAVSRLTRMALCTAVLCTVAPLSLPIGPVSLTLGVFGVLLCGALLPPDQALLATTAYLLLGLAGLPVFAGFGAGPGALFGVTGGYLLAYPLIAAVLSGVCAITRRPAARMAGVALANLCCYTLGTGWFMWMTGQALLPALTACVLPFVLPDLFKGWCALALAAALERRRVRL